ncbi:Small subunit (SSU) processome component [Ceratocystis pirilliformis]|uniref:Small subunit (SSU) processome component n=1 Tax=Ceratocystis pirilliformis TaxID=259994 RepID=A0ABR3YZP9_9PEZI
MVSQAKRKAPSKITAPRLQTSAKPVTKAAINEIKAAVSMADIVKLPKKQRDADTIEISSDSDSNDDDSDPDEEMAEGDESTAAVASISASTTAGVDAEDSDVDGTSPTFGELVHTQETVDVSAALATRSSTAQALASTTQQRTVAAPSLSSLSTVLTQALRTDDAELLESCLATANLATVRNTIERLDSALAGSLLSKLAARIYRRPGRAGTLLQWVQWVLVAHGGALASQPEVMAKLATLQKVLVERSRGLNSLLVLKGKLDLLESQMQLRKKMQSKESRRDNAEEIEDENVIWVEGAASDEATRRGAAGDDEDDYDEVPTANGIMGDSDEEDDDEEDDDDDDEDDDEDDEDEDDVDHSDVDESGEDDESEPETAPPTKMRKTGGGFTKSK